MQSFLNVITLQTYTFFTTLTPRVHGRSKRFFRRPQNLNAPRTLQCNIHGCCFSIFIHPVVSYDRSIASSESSSPHSAIQCFRFQLPVGLSSRFFKAIQQLLTSSSSSSCCFRHSTSLSLRNLFQKAVSIQSFPVALFIPSPVVQGHVHFSVRITFPPILKPPNHSRASLVRYSPYEVNRISDRQHHYLNPLPIFNFFSPFG